MTQMWHQRAAPYGFKGSAAFPISVGGKVWGAFTVYSTAVGGFGDEEVRLLKEGAQNIGFALDNIELGLQKRETEKALAESEQRYHSLVELSPDAILIFREEGKINYVNAAGLRLFGASSPNDLIGKQMLDIVAPGYKEQVSQRLRIESRRLQAVPVVESKAVRLDGTTVDVEVTAGQLSFKQISSAGHLPGYHPAQTD